MSIRDVIQRELRSLLVFADVPPAPPPHDLDAEAVILSAILSGDVTHAELAPLAEKHFYADINRAIWRASKQVAPGDVVGVHTALVTAGWRGSLAEELFTVAATQPFRCLPRLRDDARRMIELWARRELIAVMGDLDVRLRHGLIDSDGARETLSKFLSEVLG